MQTVGELASYLEAEGISPETLAERVKISNMTLRRLLKRRREARIPEKYQVQLAALLGRVPLASNIGASREFAPLLSEIESSGRTVEDIGQLKKDVRRKLSAFEFSAEFLAEVGGLFRKLSGKLSARDRALCIGALLYFLNPFDLIPDQLVGVGFLDDFAVITLVSGILAKNKSKDMKETTT